MNICIYGASSETIPSSYLKEAENFGAMLSLRGHRLIFGGGNTGLMGATARGVYKNNGQLIGISPHFFNQNNILYSHCTKLIFTNTMRERKQKMEELSDAFVMLPGGIGTFEEFFEILTLKQLHRHQKAIAVLNTNGYFNPMSQMLKQAIQQDFMESNCLSLFQSFTDLKMMLNYLETYQKSNLKLSPLQNA